MKGDESRGILYLITLIHSKKHSPALQQGFILVAVLVLLTVLTVGAALFALWVERRLTVAFDNQKQRQLALDVLSSRNALLYLFSTHPMHPQGLLFKETGARSASALSSDPADVALIRLDDRPYQGYGDCVFSIQDEAGLSTVNFFVRYRLSTLLGILKVPYADRGPLMAKLLDYQDGNDLLHLHGAERKQYVDAGLPSPPNRQLFNPWETAAVYDWPAHLSIPQLARMTTVSNAGAINVNTATAETIQALPGLTLADANNILRFREQYPITGIRQLELILGKRMDHLDMEIMFIPSLAQRLTFWDAARHRAKELHILLTPFSEHGSPWIIDTPVTFSTASFTGKQFGPGTDNHAEKLPFFQKKILSDKPH